LDCIFCQGYKLGVILLVFSEKNVPLPSHFAVLPGRRNFPDNLEAWESGTGYLLTAAY